jgi:hypothetical protein
MNIYIAAVFGAKDRLQPVRQKLTELGYTVTSSWLDEENLKNYTNDTPATDLITPELALEYAQRDMSQVAASDIFAIDTQELAGRGGREVEFGLALSLGLTCHVVGPKPNVFHQLADAQFKTWEEALEFYNQRQWGT